MSARLYPIGCSENVKDGCMKTKEKITVSDIVIVTWLATHVKVIYNCDESKCGLKLVSSIKTVSFLVNV